MLIRDVWRRNPLSFGAYSFCPPEYLASNYRIERGPERNRCFSGEHIGDSQAHGYMNSALATGVRGGRDACSVAGPRLLRPRFSVVDTAP
jgi:hypothetical protein